MGTRVTRRVLAMAVVAALGAGVAVAATGAHTGTVNALKTAKYGTLLVSANGRTLYHETIETHGKIKCTGACATFWPPLTISKGVKPSAGAGIEQAKLGTIKRPDGKIQVTYNGFPLYRYGDDKKRGDVKGQGEEHIWFVIAPSGKLVKSGPAATATTSSPTTTSSTPTTTSGGYGYGVRG
jgi:predicted lipoprotein with Yx(FWY)xxD motif